MNRSKLIKILLFAFMALAVYSYKKSEIKSAASDVVEKTTQITSLFKEPGQPPTDNKTGVIAKTDENTSFFERKIATIISNAMESHQGKEIIKDALKQWSKQDPKTRNLLQKNFFTQDTIVGIGANAVCGQNVVVTYTTPVTLPSTVSTTKQTEAIKLGNNSLPKALEAAIVGMRKGGNRQVTFSKTKIDPTKKQQNLHYSEVSMVELLPLTRTILTRPIFSKNTINNPSPLTFNCGDEIVLHYTIHDMNDQLLYDSKIANTPSKTLKIGSDQLPHQISNTLDNLSIDHRLFVTLPMSEIINFGFIEVPSSTNNGQIVLLTLEPSLSK